MGDSREGYPAHRVSSVQNKQFMERREITRQTAGKQITVLQAVISRLRHTLSGSNENDLKQNNMAKM